MKTFMKGAVLLTMAGFIVKLLSAIYRVPFQNLVGDQGFYIYQQVYPFVGIFSVWTSYGFAVAVSKLLADSEKPNHGAILRISLGFIAAVSLAVFLVLFLGAEGLAGWMGDGQLAPLLQIAALAVLLMAPIAVMKGHFQSRNHMQPVAYAQVMEQAIRVSVILLGSWLVVMAGYSLYAAGSMAILGAAVGELAAVLLLFYFFRRSYHREERRAPAIRPWPIIKKMTVISLSISMSSLILLFFQLVDSFSVFRLLTEAGVDRMAAMEQKGVYDRGQPLVQFGILMATSLALAIVPLVAQMAKNPSGRPAQAYAQLAFRVSFLFAFASAAGLSLVMPYVNEMLFETREESAALIVFSWQIVWMALLLVLTSLLYGLGKVKIPAWLLAGGIGVKIIGNWLLIPIWEVTGAALAGNIGLAFVVFGLLLYFKRVWPIRLAPKRYYGWIFAAASAMAIAVAGWSLFADGVLFDGLESRLSAALIAVTAVLLGAAVFLVVVARSRIITEREWFIIPFGRKLAGLQLKLNARKKGDRI
ncbi:putative polysaccharide biosynthesis protein [Planococcus massiliensis]